MPMITALVASFSNIKEITSSTQFSGSFRLKWIHYSLSLPVKPLYKASTKNVNNSLELESSEKQLIAQDHPAKDR